MSNYQFVAVRENKIGDFLMLAWYYLGEPGDGATVPEWFEACYQLGCDISRKSFPPRLYESPHMKRLPKVSGSMVRWIFTGAVVLPPD